MPVRYSIDPGLQLVRTVFSGELTDADLREHVRSLHADPAFNAKMRELVDLTGVTRATVTADGVATIAASLVHSPHARRALVASTDEVFGLSRMYQLYRDRIGAEELQVFRESVPALEWLGLDSPPEDRAVP